MKNDNFVTRCYKCENCKKDINSNSEIGKCTKHNIHPRDSLSYCIESNGKASFHNIWIYQLNNQVVGQLQTVRKESMEYKAEYKDGNFENITADTDSEALTEAWNKQNKKEHGILFNLFEIDENYDEIRTIL